jgi:hypothetical protein
MLGLGCAMAWPIASWADASAEARAHALFLQATQGQDRAAIEPAAAAYAELWRQHPNDLVLMAYTGATTAMLATTTWLPWRKMRFADDGLALLDKALARLSPTQNTVAYRATPAVLEIQFTAANTFLALPSLFNRRERGLSLLSAIVAHPLFKTAPTAFQTTVQAAQRRAQPVSEAASR